MRMTELLAPTLRETPSEAEIPSHQLMLRAGLMRKSVSGVYTYLPLGYRVIRKVEQIVREEMDRQGGQEVLMPALQPGDLWKQTGRWDDYGSEMFRLKDRGGRDLCLGPTHEENITSLTRDEVRSYRQLPKLLYQIQTKFRDEIRPRFGLMRAREFIMKDLYSFDVDDKGLDKSYKKMYEAYCRAFDRCGLDYKIVEADVGAIGGTSSHEFMVISDIGEASLVLCESCGYAANVERADVVSAPNPSSTAEIPPPRRIETPGVRTIEQLESFLGITADRMIKTLVYLADGTPVAALVRGDRVLNEVKLKTALACRDLELAPDDVIVRVTGAPVGYAGPVGLRDLRIVADPEVLAIESGVTGANAVDEHIVDVKYGRDYVADRIADIRNAVGGDPCPSCGKPLIAQRGVEVGHLFKLGTKYSEALGAKYVDEAGQENLMIMGCYGIGITRIVAAVVERSHDEHGIKWPISIAPYQVMVVVVNPSDEPQRAVAEKVYAELLEAGVETLIDDRDERPGVKFKDADLIGIPLRVTVGQKSLDEGKVEVKVRRNGYVDKIDVAAAAKGIREIIKAEMDRLLPVQRSLE